VAATIARSTESVETSCKPEKLLRRSEISNMIFKISLSVRADVVPDSRGCSGHGAAQREKVEMVPTNYYVT